MLLFFKFFTILTNVTKWPNFFAFEKNDEEKKNLIIVTGILIWAYNR